MRKINLNLLAVSFIFCATCLLIAGMYFTSFERNHTHDWPNQKPYSQNITSPENDVMADGLSQSEGGASVPQANKPQSYPPYTDTQSLQHQDHKAQILMAVFTAIGLFIGGAGLYLIYRTLIETGSAAKAAADTLKVAQDTLDLGKKTARIEMQPYISIEVKDIQTHEPKRVSRSDGSFVNIGFTVSIEITNVGKTPAENMFLNIASAAGLPMSRGKFEDGPYSAETIKKTSHQTTMGAASLGANDTYKRIAPISFIITDADIEGFDSDPLKANAYFTLAIRVSFRDKFTDPEEHQGMLYERRVYISDYWHFQGIEGVRPAISSLEIPAQKVDYPEEHNKRDQFWPLGHYGSGALSLIKLRDTPTMP